MIEILVVIAIIAILAGILFPVISRAKAKARQTQCIVNLSQIGHAMTLYMADYNDVFPLAVDASDKYAPVIWSSKPEWQALIASLPMMQEALELYTKNKETFHCPSDTGTRSIDTSVGIPFFTSPSLFATYGMSYFFRTEIAFRSLSGTAFQSPADVNVMFDGAGHWHGAARQVELGDDSNTAQALFAQYRYNVLFGDMHVKSADKGQLDRLWRNPL